MSIITRALKQTCLYWAPSSVLGYDGNPSGWEAPIEIKCRWSIKERYHVLETGTQVVSQSEAMVGQDVKKSGFLMLATLSDLEGLHLDDPRVFDEAYEIMKIVKLPNLRVTQYYRKAFMTWQK